MPNVLAGIAAAVCAFLALLVILGMFQVHGVVLDGLWGDPRPYRPWVLVRRTGPVVGVMGAGILPGEAAHRPAVVSGAAPVVGGAFLHVVLGPTHTTLVVSQLWREGLQGVGGGVISGAWGCCSPPGSVPSGQGPFSCWPSWPCLPGQPM